MHNFCRITNFAKWSTQSGNEVYLTFKNENCSSKNPMKNVPWNRPSGSILIFQEFSVNSNLRRSACWFGQILIVFLVHIFYKYLVWKLLFSNRICAHFFQTQKGLELSFRLQGFRCILKVHLIEIVISKLRMGRCNFWTVFKERKRNKTWTFEMKRSDKYIILNGASGKDTQLLLLLPLNSIVSKKGIQLQNVYLNNKVLTLFHRSCRVIP